MSSLKIESLTYSSDIPNCVYHHDDDMSYDEEPLDVETVNIRSTRSRQIKPVKRFVDEAWVPGSGSSGEIDTYDRGYAHGRGDVEVYQKRSDIEEHSEWCRERFERIHYESDDGFVVNDSFVEYEDEYQDDDDLVYSDSEEEWESSDCEDD